MSLNGLSELPDAAAACLAGWKGRQLELMGLRKTAGIEYLAKWEASGGRLFVPENIRQQIESARRAGQPQVPPRKSGRP